jgi:hypothetical protein
VRWLANVRRLEENSSLCGEYDPANGGFSAIVYGNSLPQAEHVNIR